MGSSGSGAVDYGTGPIVWVRRRNGSWWPGKILGPEDLSECNLTSPRTGTPVKLLGREDASVDWYNLEKSKRVKAFRCGEFDDCIERAEAAQGMPIKKREKYARREDAILHALELERELLRKEGKYVATTTHHTKSKSSGSAKEPAVALEGVRSNTGTPGNAELNQVLTRVDTTIKDEIVGDSLKAKDENQPLSEDDRSDITPRMRGLRDFGLRTASLKRKNASSVDSDGSEKLLPDNHIQAHLVGAPSMERTIHVNGKEQMGAVPQAKRSKHIYFPAEINDSVDDKEVPPNQIKTFEDDDGHPYHGSLIEQNSSSGFMEDVESDDSSETDSSESESDSSETEPDVDDESVYPDTGIHSEAERDVLRRPEAQEHESTSSEEHDELAFSGQMHHLYRDDPFQTSEPVSKWQLKGKRNIRHLTRKYVDRVDGKVFTGPLYGSYHRTKGNTLGQRAYGFDDADFDRDYFGSQIVGRNNGRYSYKSRFVSKGRNTGRSGINWKDVTWEDRPDFRARWERAEHFNPMILGRRHFGGRTRTMLIDVDLKVQASYQKEPVPIVSLMSKLNGKAVIGHPIQIEALEDGSSENVISTNDCHSNEAVDHDANASVPPAWRTARRTNLRVPRPYLPSVLGGEDVSEDSAFIDQEGRLKIKKSSLESFTNKAGLLGKNLPHISRPTVDSKLSSSRKLSKKSSLSSNQKTRTLSSISVQQNFGVKPIHYGSFSQMDGIIKPETSGPTTVACIPVKLVFSRLLEKINRPPSKAACKVVMSNMDSERKPS